MFGHGEAHNVRVWAPGTLYRVLGVLHRVVGVLQGYAWGLGRGRARDWTCLLSLQGLCPGSHLRPSFEGSPGLREVLSGLWLGRLGRGSGGLGGGSSGGSVRVGEALQLLCRCESLRALVDIGLPCVCRGTWGVACGDEQLRGLRPPGAGLGRGFGETTKSGWT